MSKLPLQTSFFRIGLKTGICLSAGVLLAAPAWAQRTPRGPGRAPSPPRMPAPMPMPQRPAPMPMPRPAPMPQPRAPMPRTAPMQQPPAPMPRTAPSPRRPAPPPTRPPTGTRPSGPPVRAGHPPVRTGTGTSRPNSPAAPSTNPTSSSPYGFHGRAVGARVRLRSSPLFQPSGSEMGHRPVYDRSPGGIFRGGLGRLKTLPPSPQVYYPSWNYGSTWNSGYWGGNYWGSGYWGSGYWGSGIYFGTGYFCNPFDMWTWGCYNPYSLLTAGYPFYFDPAFAYLFPAPFFSFSLFSGPYPYLGSYPFGYPSYSSLFYGAPFSPTVFGPFCPICTTGNSNFSLFTLDNPYLLTASPLPPGSSASLTTGGTISSADAASASSTVNGSSGSALFAPAPTGSGQPATVSGTKLPASKQPVSLVFSDGSTVQATKYWLANGKLHYVTVAGQSQAIPLGHFDIQATMKANQRNGVRFLPPAPRQQKPAPKHP